ncbi:hypothetical protein CVU37_09750 [candidate division BRC1 bacterium HGW-BRC1-1]|nr:MAG: hypothetical protein CVU37_09750 [candidate division BRC1 bacterium HGW-BRC1-1]
MELWVQRPTPGGGARANAKNGSDRRERVGAKKNAATPENKEKKPAPQRKEREWSEKMNCGRIVKSTKKKGAVWCSPEWVIKAQTLEPLALRFDSLSTAPGAKLGVVKEHSRATFSSSLVAIYVAW